MEYLNQISTILNCTPKQLFVDNIELFEMFKSMRGLTLEESATKMINTAIKRSKNICIWYFSLK